MSPRGEDDRLDELLRRASQSLEQPSRDLFAAAETQSRRRRQRNAGFRIVGAAAAVGLILTLGHWWNSPRDAAVVKVEPAPIAIHSTPVEVVEAPRPSKAGERRPAVTVSGGADTLILQVPTRTPRVHFFWVYPVWRPEAEPQSAAAQTAEKGGKS